MSKEKILVVEDEKHISKLVVYNLEKAGFEAQAVATGEEALKLLECFPFSLIVLDIMLGGMDGFEVCRTIKQDPKLKNIPIIMLTAKGEEVDRIVGLELGADDYVVKPFSPRELTLRIKAILKRGKAPESRKNVITVRNLSIDIEKHRVAIGRNEIELTPMEFKLLLTLLERRGRLQTRDRLLSDVWDMAADVDTRTIDTHIKRLRKKLGPLGKLIETVRGLGYRFKEGD
ncbi:MAG TPA: DNA-binding response regulator [Candidatus Omnitrophica bacterium]|nr:DNA-binding response regulator [Candidatus Omnitrophota bacterium]